MSTATSPSDHLRADGFHVFDEALSEVEVAQIEAHLPSVDDTGQGGLRNVFQHSPDLARVLSMDPIRRILETLSEPPMACVRALYFDKRTEANWRVPMHQDLSIAVHAKHDLDGFTGWSTKDGVAHVQPPTGFTERMLTLRIQLDACDASNGALRVLPGTHLLGRLSTEAIRRAREDSAEVVCSTKRGGVLAMRPTILHASSSSATGARRRVLHLEFAPFDLPSPLEWHDRRAALA